MVYLFFKKWRFPWVDWKIFKRIRKWENLNNLKTRKYQERKTLHIEVITRTFVIALRQRNQLRIKQLGANKFESRLSEHLSSTISDT